MPRFITTFVFEAQSGSEAQDLSELMAEAFCNQETVQLELGHVRVITGNDELPTLTSLTFYRPGSSANGFSPIAQARKDGE